MFFRPKWFRMLRYECRPTSDKIKPLETIRRQFNIPHDAFSMRVLSSPSTARQLQKRLLSIAQVKRPHTARSNEKQLWKDVLESRLRKYIELGFEPPDILEKADQVVRKASSFDEVCDYIIALDEKETPFPDPWGIGKMVDDILAT